MSFENVVPFRLPTLDFDRALDHALKALEPRAQVVDLAERDLTRLRAARKEHWETGLRLARMSREAQEAAHEAFETCRRIDEQLSAYRSEP